MAELLEGNLRRALYNFHEDLAEEEATVQVLNAEIFEVSHVELVDYNRIFGASINREENRDITDLQ